MKIFFILICCCAFLYGENQKDLAIEQFKDQNPELALTTFVKALESAPKIPGGSLSSEEDELYKEALRVYLNNRLSVHESSALLKNRYKKNLQEHPNYYHLGYLIALAYANLGQFDRFFNLFYASYQRLPEHYLAFKGKAFIHSRLFEKASTQKEKERERNLILENLARAKKIYPNDVSLYRMEIVFSGNSEQDDKIAENVLELIKGNIVIPRTELPFFFDELLAHGHIQLAQELTKKAREWYPYSRTLDSVEDFINQKQSLKE